MKFTTLFVVAVASIALMTTVQAQQKPAADTEPRAYGDGEFRLGPDDVLEVSVYQEKELSTTVPVRPDGKISIPLIGELPASGKTATELQKEIAQKYAQYITEPAVTVVVKEVNSPKVSVLGEVKNPGVYKIKNRATVLDVIAMAGGWTDYAKKTKVTLIRPEPSGEQKLFNINLEDEFKGRRTGPVYIFPYDTIKVD